MLCLVSTVRPNYLNFLKSYSFENRITKTLGEYILSRDLNFFQEKCILIKTSDFKALVVNCYTQIKRFPRGRNYMNEKRCAVQALQKGIQNINFA